MDWHWYTPPFSVSHLQVSSLQKDEEAPWLERSIILDLLIALFSPLMMVNGALIRNVVAGNTCSDLKLRYDHQFNSAFVFFQLFSYNISEYSSFTPLQHQEEQKREYGWRISLSGSWDLDLEPYSNGEMLAQYALAETFQFLEGNINDKLVGSSLQKHCDSWLICMSFGG